MNMIRVSFQIVHIILTFLLTLYSSVFLTAANPVISSDMEAMEYLQKFGYMDQSISSLSPQMEKEELYMAIKEFQNFAGLDETGELNDETLTMMNMPRCGAQDNIGQNETTMSRYVLLGSKWKTKDLTYGVTKYSRVLKDKRKIDSEIARAFKVWSDVSALKFANKHKDQVDITLRFEVRDHGDGDPFDGPLKILAHAVDPKYGGNACFDDEETWTVDQHSGINLFQVAAHELGHSLGLGHSKVKTALMAPFYQGYQPNFKLDNDDIKGIQKLYGKPSTANPKPSSTSKPRPPPDSRGAPDLCQDSAFDAATRTGDGHTYVFKGNFYWRISKNGIDNGYPRRISTDWGNLPGNLDAAFTWKNGRTYFFKGNEYWKFRNQKMETGYPKAISSGFEGIPNDIDAAFIWSRNSKTYIFKGDKYWRYDSENEPPVGSQYPKSVSNWEGLPRDINAALQWSDGKTYFFKNKEFYKYNDKTFSVDEADPPYPRGTSEWWFKCQDQHAIYEDLSKELLEEEDQKPVYIGNDHTYPVTTATEPSKDDVDASNLKFMEQYNRGDPNFFNPGFGYASSANILWSANIFTHFIVIFVVNSLRLHFM